MAFDFGTMKVSVEGVGELNSAMAEDWEFGIVPEFPKPDWSKFPKPDWFKMAAEQAESIGLRTDDHPEGTLAHGCRLWIGDQHLVSAHPQEIVCCIQGIKLALQMMMRGEITCERQEAKE